MEFIDPRSIAVIAFGAYLLQFSILGILKRGVAKELPGLSLTVWGAGFWVVGCGLIIGRAFLPPFFTVVLGNIGISGGTLTLHAALMRCGQSRTEKSYRMHHLAAVFGLAMLFIFTQWASYKSLLLFITGFNAILFSCCMVTALTLLPASFAFRFSASAFFLAALTSATRFFLMAQSVDHVSQIFDPSIFQKLYFAAISFSLLMILVSFILITYERLNRSLSDLNHVLEEQVAARTVELVAEIERKQVLERLLSSSAEAERRRIGYELHDDLGQRLTGISLVAESMARTLATSIPEASRQAEAIQQATSEAIAQVRDLAHGLMPVGPEPESFGHALEALAVASSVPGLECRVEYDEPVDICNQDVATNLYRIAQEAITNAIRHAKATKINLKIDLVNGKVQLIISDNGTGFPSAPDAQATDQVGRGMSIMDFRAALIGFRMEVATSPGAGSIVKVLEC